MSIPLPHLTPGAFSLYVEQFIRARDLEVARLVLEAAALVAQSPTRFGYDVHLVIADAIRALEVSHAE